MREIKFRAYIGDLKGVYEVLTIARKLNDEVGPRVFIHKKIKEGEQLNYLIDGKKNFLMQYTGLKDSKGKEIYEGDILTANFDTHKLAVVITHPFSKQLMQISSFDYINYYNREDKKIWIANGCRYANDGDVIIIGNIYENPNLLTK